MKKNDKKKKQLLVLLLILIVGLSIFFVSYSYYRVSTNETTTLNDIDVEADCFDISLTQSGLISLSNYYPVSDSYALSNISPINVSVTNNCVNNMSEIPYALTLTSLSNATGYIGDYQIKTKVLKTPYNESETTLINNTNLANINYLNSGATYTYLTNDLGIRNETSSFTNKKNYLIDNSTIDAGETVSYKIYLWLDYYEGDPSHQGVFDNTTQNKNFSAVLSVVYGTRTESGDLVTGGYYTQSLTGGLYRYRGYNDVSYNNYICFGTNNVSDCINNPDKYMYRIIGINETGNLKIIKKEALDTAYAWNSTQPAPAWSSSSLYNNINGAAFLTNTLFVPDSTWSDLIQDHDWKYGSAAINGYNAATYYSNYQNWTDTATSTKVGITYPHDYLYAHPIDNPSGRNAIYSWLSLKFNDDGTNYSSQNPPSIKEWTMATLSTDNNKAILISDGGGFDTSTNANVNTANSVRPVMYLVPVNLSGIGTLNDPFIILSSRS